MFAVYTQLPHGMDHLQTSLSIELASCASSLTSAAGGFDNVLFFFKVDSRSTKGYLEKRRFSLIELCVNYFGVLVPFVHVYPHLSEGA